MTTPRHSVVASLMALDGVSAVVHIDTSKWTTRTRNAVARQIAAQHIDVGFRAPTGIAAKAILRGNGMGFFYNTWNDTVRANKRFWPSLSPHVLELYRESLAMERLTKDSSGSDILSALETASESMGLKDDEDWPSHSQPYFEFNCPSAKEVFLARAVPVVFEHTRHDAQMLAQRIKNKEIITVKFDATNDADGTV